MDSNSFLANQLQIESKFDTSLYLLWNYMKTTLITSFQMLEKVTEIHHSDVQIQPHILKSR